MHELSNIQLLSEIILLARYPAPRSFLISFSWTVQAIHLPPAPDPDIFGKSFWAEKRSAWALGLEWKGNGRVEKGVGEREGSYPLIKAAKVLRLPTCPLKTLIRPSATIDGTVGLPTPVLMRIPQWGDMISASTRHADKTASRYVWWLAVKNGSNNDWTMA